MSPLLSLALLLAVADSAVLPSGDQIGSPAEEVYAGIPPAEYYSEVPGRFLKETKPKRKFCNTTQYALKGDYAYEACGAFCKQAKAPNHCKFCKCRAYVVEASNPLQYSEHSILALPSDLHHRQPKHLFFALLCSFSCAVAPFARRRQQPRAPAAAPVAAQA